MTNKQTNTNEHENFNLLVLQTTLIKIFNRYNITQTDREDIRFIINRLSKK